MPEPVTIMVSTKNLIYGLLAAFGINIIGWRLFAKSKLDEIKDHEKRLREIERNYPGLKYLNALGSSVTDKLDILAKSQEDQHVELNKRVDGLYNILLQNKNTNSVL